MTGFARASGDASGARWTWELRAVNGKGLDIRLRLPPGLEAIESQARKKFAASLSRGNIQVALAFEKQTETAVPVLNEEALEAVWQAALTVASRYELESPKVADLLSQRGVLDMKVPVQSDDERALLEDALLASLETAIANLVSHRRREGAALIDILLGHVDRIEALTQKAVADPSRSPDEIRRRLSEQVALLDDGSGDFDPARLHQEAVILAAKADLREELDRLQAHADAAREMLQGDEPVGRKLDFLAQEFNREANTLCSKSNSTAITAIGLELKLSIDQFREQLQNLE